MDTIHDNKLIYDYLNSQLSITTFSDELLKMASENDVCKS